MLFTTYSYANLAIILLSLSSVNCQEHTSKSCVENALDLSCHPDHQVSSLDEPIAKHKRHSGPWQKVEDFVRRTIVSIRGAGAIGGVVSFIPNPDLPAVPSTSTSFVSVPSNGLGDVPDVPNVALPPIPTTSSTFVSVPTNGLGNVADPTPVTTDAPASQTDSPAVPVPTTTASDSGPPVVPIVGGGTVGGGSGGGDSGGGGGSSGGGGGTSGGGGGSSGGGGGSSGGGGGSSGGGGGGSDGGETDNKPDENDDNDEDDDDEESSSSASCTQTQTASSCLDICATVTSGSISCTQTCSTTTGCSVTNTASTTTKSCTNSLPCQTIVVTTIDGPVKTSSNCPDCETSTSTTAVNPTNVFTLAPVAEGQPYTITVVADFVLDRPPPVDTRKALEGMSSIDREQLAAQPSGLLTTTSSITPPAPTPDDTLPSVGDFLGGPHNVAPACESATETTDCKCEGPNAGKTPFCNTIMTPHQCACGSSSLNLGNLPKRAIAARSFAGFLRSTFRA
ncbi:hypothetical protein GLAREA_11605 [Glarea lozoyensis ATCC 20868]|uniref:Extracellular membrane protein CFEM domain-containing protein n=1 Tax=Glarea lozoyensis (strain ATCC 20868 / MF5171) TaxID=1116229 RepID=S3CID4_GLAL2|nr:uncharacterized protein GLAREA_11605 [Glarea lozoyensis ATCC 20868]EPE25024.1 hypothetical protein GLAREA_11605 [Glarea lozoyensis ATCC 20868]